MCQAKNCFNAKTLDQLTSLKKTLAAVRMPAAKMEKAGISEPVISNRSPAGWNLIDRDLYVNDPEEQVVSARSILAEFDHVFSAITKDDVLARHEESYSIGHNTRAKSTH